MLSAARGAGAFEGQYLPYKSLKAGINTQTQDKSAGTAPQAASRTETVRPVEASGKSERTSTREDEARDAGGKPSLAGEPELTKEQEQQVRELKKRDEEVRAHEQAHATVGGSYASAPSYEYTTGPDGKRYVTSGEVKIDASPVRDNPEATIRKMDIVIRAALAPAEPSSADLAVAKKAQQERSKAQTELLKQRAEERNPKSEENSQIPVDPLKALLANQVYSDATRRATELADTIISNVFETAA